MSHDVSKELNQVLGGEQMVLYANQFDIEKDKTPDSRNTKKKEVQFALPIVHSK